MPRTLADTHVSLFRHAYESHPIQTVTLIKMLEAIQSGRYQPQVDRLRRILAREGKAAYARAKAHLPAVTFGGTFAPSRGTAHLRRHSGIVHGDLDHLDNVRLVKQALSGDPRTVYVFRSPSGHGVKVGVHVPVVATDAAYKHAWHHVRADYEQRYGLSWDPSGKDVSRLCYVSHDPELYCQPAAERFCVPPMLAQAPRPVKHSRRAPRLSGVEPDYASRAIQTATQMIQSALLGTRHHTRLRAARLLGGYVAGGLLTEEQAYHALAAALVGHTEDLERALKTVEDGLAYGQAHPITVEALEAERMTWLTQQRNPHPRQQLMPPDNPWEGMNTLPLKPYVGYQGLQSRMHGKGVTRGHSH